MVQKNTHIAFASSYIMNHTGMRETQEQQIFPAVKSAQSERQVCGGWCVCVCPQEATSAVLTGPETHREVLLPKRENVTVN